MKTVTVTKPMGQPKMQAMMNQAKMKPNPDYSSSNLAKELGKRQKKRQLTAL